jgi:hypothetical protein
VEIFVNVGSPVLIKENPGVSIYISDIPVRLYFVKIHASESMFSVRAIKGVSIEKIEPNYFWRKPKIQG